MLGLHPWKRIRPNGPVNKPGSDWFNAVTNVLSTMGVRLSPGGANAYIDRPNRDGNGWNIVIPWPGSVQPCRWKAKASAATTIDVGDGVIHRLGTDYGWASDTLTGFSTGSWIIFSRIVSGAVVVDKVAAASWPLANEPKDTGYPAHRIAYVTTSGGAIESITQLQFSDIDEECAPLDSTGSAEAIYSSLGTSDRNLMEMYGFKAGSEAYPGSLYPSSYINGTTLTWIHTQGTGGICYVGGVPAAGDVSISGFCAGGHTHSVDAASIDSAIGDCLDDWITTWTDDDHPSYEHRWLTGRDYDEDSHPLLYWLMGGDSSRCYGSSIGNAASATVIDLTAYTLMGADWYVGATGAHQNLGVWGDCGALTFTLDSAANNSWDSADLKVQVTADIRLLCTQNLNLAPSGQLQINGAAGRTVSVMASDEATGAPVKLTFAKGFLTV